MYFYRAEVESLEEAVSKERARYQMSTQALSSGLSAISLLPINDSVKIDIQKYFQKSANKCLVLGNFVTS